MPNPNIRPGETVFYSSGNRGEVLADDDERIPAAHRLSPATRALSPDSVYVLYDEPLEMPDSHEYEGEFGGRGRYVPVPAHTVYGGWFRTDTLQLSVKVKKQ